MIALDYSDDYKWWDQTEAVTLKQERNTAAGMTGSTPYAVATAKRVSTDERVATFAGFELSGIEVFWCIPAALASAPVVEGDVITDGDDVDYHVKAVKTIRKGPSISYYRCATTEEQ